MSATEQIRAILDDLMGTTRDGSSSNRTINPPDSKRYRDRDERNRYKDRPDRPHLERHDRERPRERERERERDRSRERNREREWRPNSRDRPRFSRDRREILYERRLKELEKREAEKQRKYALRLEEEESRRLLEQQESRKLKEFLEDYNDDRDDVRFYRGSALARRLADRRREIKMDEASSLKEQMDLKILSKEYKLCMKSATNNSNNNSNASSNNNIPSNNNTSSNNNNNNNTSNHNQIDERIHNNANTTSNDNSDPVDNVSNNTNTNDNITNDVPLENRKEQVEKLIKRIPTTKEDLFAWQLDWSLLDENLMEKRIRPWVAKKIAYFFDDMGEKENDLISWICKSLNAHADGNSILKQVALVLDNDAEKFIVQMWRLLVFEFESKASGLRK